MNVHYIWLFSDFLTLIYCVHYSRGLWGSCLQVGGVLANTFAAAVVDYTGTWRAAFWYAGVALGISGAVLGLVLPAQERSLSTVSTSSQQKGNEQKHKPTYMDAVLAPGVLNLALAYLCIKCVTRVTWMVSL